MLNFHPCAYDAYGMTIVEAASQGAPSVVAAGGGVGATDLLTAERGEVFLLDFGVPAERLAEQVWLSTLTRRRWHGYRLRDQGRDLHWLLVVLPPTAYHRGSLWRPCSPPDA